MKEKKIKKRLDKYLRKYFPENSDELIKTRAVNTYGEYPTMDIFMSGEGQAVRTGVDFYSEEDKEILARIMPEIVNRVDLDAVVTVSELWELSDSKWNCAPSQDPNRKEAILVYYCDHNGNDLSAIAILDENRGIKKVKYKDEPSRGRFGNYFGYVLEVKVDDVQEFIASFPADLKRFALSKGYRFDLRINVSDRVKRIQGEEILMMRMYGSVPKGKSFVNIY